MRWQYEDTEGVVRVMDAPDGATAGQRIYDVELERSGSVAAASIAVRSAQPYTWTPGPKVMS